MGTLNIGGRAITIDDSFKTLSPDDQQKTVDEISSHLDAALPPMYSDAAKKAMSDNFGFADAVGNALTLGDVGQKIGSAVAGGIQGAIVDPLMGRGFHVGDRYNEDLAMHRDMANKYATEHPVASAVGTTAGTVLALPYLPAVGKGLSGAVKSGAVYGGVTGAAQDADSASERLGAAAAGAGLGAGLGVGGALAVKAAPAVARAVAAPIVGAIDPKGMASSVLERAVQKSGQSLQYIQDSIAAAHAEGNAGFATADALGTKGQNLLSTIARSPNDFQQPLADILFNRQAGQSGRVGGFVKDALGANLTADQASALLAKARAKVADVNYGAARNGAGPVDLTETINKIDSLVGSPTKFNVGINPDSTEGALLNLRDSLAAGNGKEGLTARTDFKSLLAKKQDLSDQVSSLYRAGKNNQAIALDQVVTKLDQALSDASPGYRNANDTFAQMSRPIEAVGTGGQAARPSMRAGDNIQTFQKLDPVSQMAHNTGYADSLLARIESSAPGVNTVRPLLADKSQQELGAFAKDPALLNRQLDRENVMNATLNRALGGSKTADNLLNEAQMSAIDPSTLLNLAKHPITGTLGLALSKGADLVTGRNGQVRAELGKMLMDKDPKKYVALLNAMRQSRDTRLDSLIQMLSPGVGVLAGQTQ